jgi:hypothetical protein
MVDLSSALSGHARLGLDTAVFIYHLEQHPRYFPLTHGVLVEGTHFLAKPFDLESLASQVRQVLDQDPKGF